MKHGFLKTSAITSLSLSMLLPVMADSALAQGVKQIEEIVVSARKREETLQEVPLSVSAITGTQLENGGITSVDDIYGRVPGLYFSLGGGAAPTSDFTYISIRGVGFNAGLEPATGVFVDGMYQPQVGYDMAFLDLERLEVLRGPQGTLFGRNTQAGAINMVTRKPGDEFRGSTALELAQFNTVRLRSSISGPIGEGLYAGVSAEYARSDGYVHNATLDRDEDPSEQITARGVVRWVPNDKLEMMLVADVFKKDFNDLAMGVPLAPRKYDAIADEYKADSKDNLGVQLNIDYKITPDITLTSISGYRKAKSNINIDYDGIPTDQSIYVFPASPSSPLTVNPVAVQGVQQTVDLEQEFMSEELRLAGTSEKFDWLVGAYYFKQNMDQGRQFNFGPGARFIPLHIDERFFEKRDGWAIFGQVSFRPVEKLELTAGGRYSDETSKVGGPRILALNSGGDVFIPLNKSGKASFSNFSGMLSAGYDISDAVNVYATFAQGWKAGGLNRYPSRQNAVQPYDDEKSNNYEIGLKSSFFDRKLTANLAAFWIDIKGQQLLNVVPDPNGLTPITVIDNAGKSRSKGVELELTAYPVEGLQVALNGSYANTRFREFLKKDAAGNAVDFAGKHFENTPVFTGTASLSYTYPVQADASLEFFVEYRYVDNYQVADGSLVAGLGDQVRVPSYDRVDARVSYQTDSGYRVTLYVDNLLDSFDYNYIARDPVVGGDFFLVKPLEPRQFGLILRKDF